MAPAFSLKDEVFCYSSSITTYEIRMICTSTTILFSLNSLAKCLLWILILLAHGDAVHRSRYQNYLFGRSVTKGHLDLQRLVSSLVMELLSSISSRAREPENELTISPALDQPLLKEEIPGSQTPLDVKSPDDALSALTSKPTFENLARTLKWLLSTSTSENDFNILKPSPKAAQIVFSLVDQAIPDYWPLLQDQRSIKSPKARTHLLKCLSSTTGSGAIVSRLRSLLDEFKNRRQNGKDAVASGLPLETLVEVLEAILQSDHFLEGLLKSMRAFYDPQTVRSSLLWREAVSLFGSGRLLTLVAEVNLALNEVSKDVRDGSWIGRGDQYAAWLGRNLSLIIEGLGRDEVLQVDHEAQLMSKALSLGYTGELEYE